MVIAYAPGHRGQWHLLDPATGPPWRTRCALNLVAAREELRPTLPGDAPRCQDCVKQDGYAQRMPAESDPRRRRIPLTLSPKGSRPWPPNMTRS